MRYDTPCQLTAKDFSVLEGMMDRLEDQALQSAAVKRLLRRKLTAARVRFGDDIDPRVATINSRIEYQIGDGRIETRVLTHGGENALPGTALPISSLHGLALLGLTDGDTIAVETGDGETDVLRVVRIVHQPEAARVRRRGPSLRVVTTGARITRRHAKESAAASEDDDRGPSAA